jgi:hypothetical protein
MRPEGKRTCWYERGSTGLARDRQPQKLVQDMEVRVPEPQRLQR